MSQWTHINAVIRFDALRVITGMGGLPHLGNTCTFESSESEMDACNVPCGSEGSLQYSTWENPSYNSLAAYTVMFWGDLRDYSDHDEILAYFTKITTAQMVRSGILEIDIEGQPPIGYRYDFDIKGWKMWTT